MKQKTRTKALSRLLCLALTLSLMPGMSMTALAADNGKYREYTWDATSKTLSYEDKSIPDDAITLTAESTAWTDGGWYIVPEGGITIGDRITVTGTANLILRDGATLTASKGITVNSGDTLNIYAQSAGTGELSAGNDSNAASIGGGARYQSGGTVNIHGGKITATGGYAAAGIGGALDGGNGEVNIYGGDVTAQGSNFAAGIGGYSGKSGGTVNIYGGIVNASGSAYGTTGIGIGGTEPGSCVVHIYGGEVTATSEKAAAGIQGTVTIDGGTVTAKGGGNSNTINASSGETYSSNGINGTVTVNGGTVTAFGGNVTVTGDYPNAIDSTGGTIYACSGINGTVTISGGTVTATGGNVKGTIYNYRSGTIYACNGVNGTVTISGGTVTATGGSHTGNSYGTTVKEKGFGGSLTIGDSMKVLGGDSADPTEEIEKSNGDYARSKYMLVKLGHVHSFTYEASDATITATCGSHDNCPLASSDYKATLTIAPSSTGGYGATLSGDKTTFGVTDSDIEYSSNDGANWSTAVPTSVGSYQARITVRDAADNTKAYTATVSYGVNSITIDAADHGTVTAPAVAGGGATITLTVTPATGYQIGTVKYNETTITPSEGVYKFTMPTEAVTVTATFVGKTVAATLNVADAGETACGASLLELENGEYKTVTGSLSKKAGEKFILSVSTDEDYDYTVDFDPAQSGDLKNYITEFSADDYTAYANYIKEHKISVPSQTDLFWVTMPGVDSDSLNITITFAKPGTFTVLYQPTGDTPNEVWCKFTKTENGTETNYAVEMKQDAVMGDTAVWSVKVTAAFDPTKIAFATSKDNIESANLETATVSQTVSWNSITGGQYLIIGGNAKTVIAAFVTDASALSDYDSDTATFSAGQGSGATYQIAVCGTDTDGNVTAAGAVTAPENTFTKDGYDFAGWRGFEGTAPNKTEKIYDAGDSISVSENTTLNAVWNLKKSTVTLNLNGGTGNSSVDPVTYGEKLPTLENPTRENYVFNGWTVSKAVAENGVFFARGSSFDLSTPITANLELRAQWKHIHSYTPYQISDPVFNGKLNDMLGYAKACHIILCGCKEMHAEAHSFDSSGKCACGYQKPTPTVTLNVSYGQWENNSYTARVTEFPQTATKDSEVSVSAPSTWGTLKFSRWQYSTNGTTWKDLAAYLNVSFIIPCNMQVRALYVNPTTKPEVNMSATTYPVKDSASGYTFDSILFQMNYKLPDGYTYVDSGVRAGDNEGISYYELKERKRTAGEKAAWGALNFGANLLSGSLGDAFFAGAYSAATLDSNFYYEKRENSVLSEMSAATLGDYMYQNKPVNVEKYPPIYWDYKPNTVSYSGSINALIPVRFAQKNNQNHYIYGIAWLRYKDSSGNIKTIYTDALAATLNHMPTNPVTKQGS